MDGTNSQVNSVPPGAVCDVVSCEGLATGSYLDTRFQAGFQFWVCAEHMERLTAGEKPLLVVERIELAKTDPRPEIIMEWSDER